MTSQNRTYYEILGVSEDASFEEIRAAFRERAREYHPDRNPSPDAVDRMAEVNEAYEVLRDEEQRAAYDRAHRTFTASPEALARAKATAAMVLGQTAFDLGFGIGARVSNHWTERVRRLEDIPIGVWHAAYEVALESALAGRNQLHMRQTALDAAWSAAQYEPARLAYRHALAERAQTFTESSAVDIEVNILGSIASVTGFALGRQNIQENLPASVWTQVYVAIRRSVSQSILLRGGVVTSEMLRESSFIDSVIDQAMHETTEVLAPYREAIGRRIGRSPNTDRVARRDGGNFAAGCFVQIVGLAIFIGIMWLLGTICIGLGLA